MIKEGWYNKVFSFAPVGKYYKKTGRVFTVYGYCAIFTTMTVLLLCILKACKVL